MPKQSNRFEDPVTLAAKLYEEQSEKVMNSIFGQQQVTRRTLIGNESVDDIIDQMVQENI